ncbi:uncharacterized protein BX663DRAFT_507660 [Cokeromyces recurvatus]|uniref:uncharacterized protein n=1 Tax=Cokeromyces recurvatus TaxID=90255 RepID=UPI00222060DF|nr:uncharacterized protein BX663DRAFT_507660 [Cokeromyces recurvatus]KAI7903159.1 hypothetical protein BX663DRAFT_507660 [Cokeromyces recurvatus]
MYMKQAVKCDYLILMIVQLSLVTSIASLNEDILDVLLSVGKIEETLTESGKHNLVEVILNHLNKILVCVSYSCKVNNVFISPQLEK